MTKGQAVYALAALVGTTEALVLGAGTAAMPAVAPIHAAQTGPMMLFGGGGKDGEGGGLNMMETSE